MITAEAQRKTAKSSQRDEEANLIFNEAESGAELRTKLFLSSASQRLCGKSFCQIKVDDPGALHHVIVPCIGRRKVFRSHRDRRGFLDLRLGIETETRTMFREEPR
jgi:hypothetical protein